MIAIRRELRKEHRELVEETFKNVDSDSL